MSDPSPYGGRLAEQSPARLSVEQLREAAARRVEQGSLRGVAREIGMSPTGLKKFLSGTAPFTPTVRRLRSWYLQHAAIPRGRVSEADARAALSVLLADFPPEIAAGFATELIGIVEQGYRASGEGVPAWVAELQGEFGRAAGAGAPVLTLASARAARAPKTGTAQERQRLLVTADYVRARRGFPNDAALAEILAVSAYRLRAWKAGAEPPDAAGALLLSHLGTVVTELDRFLDPDVIPDWLLTEHHALGGRTAVQALREGRLADVLLAVNATEHGAYT
jgi:hypothetical protein